MDSALILLIVEVTVLAGLIGLFWVLWQGPPYVPSKDASVDEMVALADLKPGERVAELGSGDGRVAIALARAGNKVDGFEINPLLVLLARRNVRRSGLAKSITISRRNFWRTDLSGYQVVTIFGIPHRMALLGKKLERELAPGSRVISNAFVIPGWQPEHRTDKALRYVIGNCRVPAGE